MKHLIEPNSKPATDHCTSICIWMCNGVLMYFFFIFGFLNPDKEAWYGITEDGKEELFPSYELGVQAGATDLTDIHSRF